MASFADAASLMHGEPHSTPSTEDILGLIVDPKRVRAAVARAKNDPNVDNKTDNEAGRLSATDGVVMLMHRYAMRMQSEDQSLFDAIADGLRGIGTLVKWAGRVLIKAAWWTARALAGVVRLVLRRIVPLIFRAFWWVVRGLLFTPAGLITVGVAAAAAGLGYLYYQYAASDDQRKKVDDTWLSIKQTLGISATAATPPRGPGGEYVGGQPPKQSQVPGSVAARAATVANVLMRNGWSREQAVGMTSTLIAESSLDPNVRPAYNEAAFGKQKWIDPATGTKYASSAYGIAQWLKARQGRFEEKFGKSIIGSSLEEQAEFFNYELRKYYPKVADMIAKSKTAADASGILTQYYEVPGGDMQDEIRKHQRFIGSVNQALGGSDTAAAQAPSAPAVADTAQAPQKEAAEKVGSAAVTRQQNASGPPASDGEYVAIGPAGRRIVTKG